MHTRHWIVASIVALALMGAGACASSGSHQVFVQPDLSAEDMERYSDLTVYEFLRRHTKVSFSSRQGGNEAMYTYSYGGSSSLAQGGDRPSVLLVNEQRALNPVQELRAMPLEQVHRLQILKATEYSARYGGSGRRGAVLITTRAEASR